METVNRFFNSHKVSGSLIILAISASLTAILVLVSDLRFTSYAGFSDPIDHHKYIYMAQHPFNFYIAPFCWRVGLPLLAGILPFDLQTNFLTLTFLAMVSSGLMLFFLLHRLDFSAFFSLTGTLLFYAAGWIIRMPLINFWVPNATAFLVILCCMLLIAGKKDIAFMVMLAVGVCVKESVLFTAPLYYMFNCRKKMDFRTALRTILLSLPAICILLLLRIIILPAQNANPEYVNSLPFILTQVQDGTAEYNFFFLLRTIAVRRFQTLSLFEIADVSFYPFGALLMILPFFALKQNLKWLAKFWPYLILVYCQLLFAVSKIGLLYLALPVLIIMAVTGLQHVVDRWPTPGFFILLLPLVTFSINLVKRNDNIDFKWLALTLALWLACGWLISRSYNRKGTQIIS